MTTSSAAPDAVAAGAPDPAIQTLKDLHLDTPLVVQGASACRIIAPTDGAWREAGLRVQAALKKICGREIELSNANAAPDDVFGRANLILLGNMMNNRVIAKLYDHHYSVTDALYPGPGGYEVRTIHNPMGSGRNCVLLGASDEAGVDLAADKFIALLAADGVLERTDNGATLQLKRLVTSSSKINPSWQADPAYVAATTKALVTKIDGGEITTQIYDTLDQGMRHYLTGDAGWGQIFRAVMLHYYDLAMAKNDWILEYKGGYTGDHYFWPWRLAMVWDNIEESPVFSDDDRRKITRLLFEMVHWVDNLDYFHPGTKRAETFSMPDELRQNHVTFASLSAFFGGEYFRYYYPKVPEFVEHQAMAAELLSSQKQSFKPNDNAVRYTPLAPRHLLSFLMSQGELDPAMKENLRKMADAIIMTTDNRADAVTYGDYRPFLKGYMAGLPFLSKAGWYFHDPGYAWAFDWIEKNSFDNFSSRAPRYEIWYEGIYYAGGPRSEPHRLTGIATSLLDQGIYDFIRRKLPRAGESEPPPPMERCFDKISMRQNFAAADEYLALSGLSGMLTHAHQDGNSVLRLTWHDRVWLADLDYRETLPVSHNSLMVRRNWEYHAIPAFTTLEAKADLPKFGFTRTAVANYNGVDWARNIFWHKGGYFLFLDEVAPKLSGSYQLQLVWRTLGDAKLAEGDLRVTQDGEDFNIKNADDSHKRLGLKPPTLFSDWSDYNHAGDAVVKIESQIQEINAAPSAPRTFVNLLFPGEAKQFGVQRLGPRTARIISGGTTEAIVGVGADGPVAGGFEVRAAAFHIGRDDLDLVDARRATIGGLEFESDQPVSMELNWSTARGVLLATRETEFRIKGRSVTLDGREIGAGPFKVTAGTHQLALGGSPLTAIGSSLDRGSAPSESKSSPMEARPSRRLNQAWTFEASGALQAIATADLDGDGTTETVVAMEDRLLVLDSSGAVKWSYRSSAKIGALLVADLDGHGPRAVLVAEGPTVVRLNHLGAVQWRRECNYKKSAITALATADFRGDGSRQIVAANDHSVLFEIDGAGALDWMKFQTVPTGGGIPSLLAEDLDGDGKAEILVPTGMGVGSALLSSDASARKWLVSGAHQVVRAVASADGRGKVILIGGPEGRGPLQLLDPATGRALAKVPVSDDLIDVAELTQGGRATGKIAAGYATTGLFIVDFKGKILAHTGFDGALSALIADQTERGGATTLAIGCQDGQVLLADQQGVVQAAAQLRSPVKALAVMHDRDRNGIVAGTTNGIITLLRTDSR